MQNEFTRQSVKDIIEKIDFKFDNLVTSPENGIEAWEVTEESIKEQLIKELGL